MATTSSSFPLVQRLRVVLWRLRFLLVALCLAVSVEAVVTAIAPPASKHMEVIVAARDISAGKVVSASDFQTVQVDMNTLPSDVYTNQNSLNGLTLAVSVPAGMPIWPAMLVSESLVEKAPAGTSVATIDIADDTEASLLQAGRRVSILAPPGTLRNSGLAEAETLSEGAIILALESSANNSSGLGGAFSVTKPRRKIHLAINSKDANLVIGVAASTPLKLIPERVKTPTEISTEALPNASIGTSSIPNPDKSPR